MNRCVYYAKVGTMYVGEIIGKRIVENGVVVGYSSIDMIKLVDNEQKARYMIPGIIKTLKDIIGGVEFYQVNSVRLKLSDADVERLTEG